MTIHGDGPEQNLNGGATDTKRIEDSNDGGLTEFIDCIELAHRWNVPVSWVRDQVRSRAIDPLPHINFGKYVRFLWRSPDLEAWVARRIVKGNNRRVERVQ
jgi:hypothetical protein